MARRVTFFFIVTLSFSNTHAIYKKGQNVQKISKFKYFPPRVFLVFQNMYLARGLQLIYILFIWRKSYTCDLFSYRFFQ